MSAPENVLPPLASQARSDPYEEDLRWLSARAIELVSFPPEQDLYEFVCRTVKELVGNAIVGVNSIDVETSILRVRQLAGIEHTRLRRVEEMLKRKVIGSAFEGVHEEAKDKLYTGTLVEVEGGAFEMFFGRVPKPVCLALEKFIGVRSIHSIGLRRHDRLFGNVTILGLRGARLKKSVIEAFVNQASAAMHRQQADVKARQADENLAIIARNVTDVVWMAEFEGVKELSPEVLADGGLDAETLLERWHFTFASPSAERVLGYHPRELERLKLRDLFTEQAWVRLRERFAGELATGLADSTYLQPQSPIGIEHLRSDGQPCWCEITARFLRDEQSNIVGVLGVTRDIDERRRETVALREERDRFGQLLEMQERDRSLIAYEIHDGLVQPIVAALMSLEGHLELLGREIQAEAAVERAQAAKGLLTRAISDARRLMRGLRPAELEDFGVVSALENLIAEHQTDAGPEIALTHDVRFDRLAPSLEAAVFRVVQEALVNALRHARSNRIEIRLAQCDDQLTIEVSDDGVGFDLAGRTRTGFGLDGIRQRARAFDGHAQIDSRPGRGTRITVVLPLVFHAPPCET